MVSSYRTRLRDVIKNKDLIVENLYTSIRNDGAEAIIRSEWRDDGWQGEKAGQILSTGCVNLELDRGYICRGALNDNACPTK